VRKLLELRYLTRVDYKTEQVKCCILWLSFPWERCATHGQVWSMEGRSTPQTSSFRI